MADQPTPPPATSALQIPPETQAKFSPLIEFIKASESMNDEERQYWINILPIMTPDQIKNLEDILTSEKQQLAAIDAKYTKQAATVTSAASVAQIEQNMRTKKQQREEMEAKAAQSEQAHEEELLKAIQAM